LDLISDIKDEVLKYKNLDNAKRAWITERLNVINSIENLKTFPFVKDLIKSGDLKVYGWHYVIETGELYDYCDDSKSFRLLEKRIDYDKIYNEIFTDF
ncbi:carbonic anhydrase, partial [Campylobacter hyointestinalis]